MICSEFSRTRGNFVCGFSLLSWFKKTEPKREPSTMENFLQRTPLKLISRRENRDQSSQSLALGVHPHLHARFPLRMQKHGEARSLVFRPTT